MRVHQCPEIEFDEVEGVLSIDLELDDQHLLVVRLDSTGNLTANTGSITSSAPSTFTATLGSSRAGTTRARWTRRSRWRR